jgi:hypothetical protein
MPQNLKPASVLKLGEKVCSKCGEKKNIELFPTNRTKKSGVQSICKMRLMG